MAALVSEVPAVRGGPWPCARSEGCLPWGSIGFRRLFRQRSSSFKPPLKKELGNYWRKDKRVLRLFV